MAPIKRRQGSADMEVPEAEPDDTLELQQRHKRARTSSHGTADSSDTHSPGNDDLSDDRSQQLTRQTTRHRVNGAADNGIIQTILCTNFMCHAHLEIALGPLINFIIGHNGSGKSAVLTALTICLGGKASSTNRGQSLKDFIKEGEEAAMISVKIKNSGESAYRPEMYGDSIIVERHISRTGSSAFKLKSRAGKVVSTKKSDLEEICDYFALQIDNPLNILTQDMARQFLNSSSPHDKYKFFMKGTQLEHLDGDYLIVEQILNSLDMEIWKKTEDFEVLKQRASRAEELLALAKHQDGLRVKIERYRKQLVWIQVQRVEKDLSETESQIRTHECKVGSLSKTTEDLDTTFRETEVSLKQAQDELESTQRSLKVSHDERDAVKVEFEEKRKEQARLQITEREIVEEIKRARLRGENVEEEITKERARLSNVDGGRNTQRREEIEEGNRAVMGMQKDLEQHEARLPELKEAFNVATTNTRAAETEAKQQRERIQAAKQKLDNLIRDRGHRQNAYSANLPRLLKAVERETSFKRKPMGPLGHHIRLTKPAWSSILEKSFGASLESFIVTNKEDQLRLSRLMKDTNCISPILISKEAAINTRDHEPDEKFDTPLRILEFSNDLARNSLIIGQGIDQTILIGSRKEAISAMQGERLRNVKQCFSHNKKAGDGIRLAYGYGGGLSETFVAGFKGVPRMQTDTEYQISEQRRLIAELTADCEDLEARRQDHLAQQEQCKIGLDHHKRTTRERRDQMRETKESIERLQDALELDMSEEGRLEVLQEQSKEAQQDRSTYEDSYKSLIVTKDEVYALLRDLRQKLCESDGTVAQCEKDNGSSEAICSQKDRERREALRKKNAIIEELDQAKAARDHSLQEKQRRISVVQDYVQQAEEICARVPVDSSETEESLNHVFEKLHRDLQVAEKRTGNHTDLVNSTKPIIEARNKAKEEISSSKDLAALLKTTLMRRRDRWKQFQKLITARARIQFFFLLSERGFRGRLNASHKYKTLELSVEPDETRRSSQGRTTHGLSGGEKSFSTICLLLSIWEAMGAPIRCLDEFDVFMDSVNREVSMHMMIQFARNSPGKQFVLISPQSTNKSLPDEDVKLIKMKDPERGQLPLNLTAAA